MKPFNELISFPMSVKKKQKNNLYLDCHPKHYLYDDMTVFYIFNSLTHISITQCIIQEITAAAQAMN